MQAVSTVLDRLSQTLASAPATPPPAPLARVFPATSQAAPPPRPESEAQPPLSSSAPDERGQSVSFAAEEGLAAPLSPSPLGRGEVVSSTAPLSSATGERAVASPSPSPSGRGPGEWPTISPSPSSADRTQVVSSPAGDGPLSLPISARGSAAPPANLAQDAKLDVSVEELKGVSKIYARRLARLGVSTIRDLLYCFPRRYDDFSQLRHINELTYGEQVTIVGVVWSTATRHTNRGQTITETILTDGTGTIQATWFNQPFLEKQLQAGRKIVLSGRVDEYLGRLVFSGPEWEPLQKELLHTGRLVPIYPLTEGITPRWMRRLVKSAVDEWSGKLADPLPSSVRLNLNLLDIITAIRQIHFPDNKEILERARSRLAFDEFLMIQLGVLRQRHAWREQPGQPLAVDEALVNGLIAALPFALTGAQERSLREILRDIQQPYAMSRLLQGDVGSGKTIVALIGMLMAVANGTQAAVMVPTEVLAEQHARTIQNMLSLIAEQVTAQPEDGPEPNAALVELINRARVRLLTGSVPKAEREAILRELESGEANLLVGTHALIQEGVNFRNLSFVVIDEQHRFGVNQRAALRQKAFNPHLLVMSATPIPRTLALTIYGDLDVSVIDELPPNRQKILTRWLYPVERERAYAFLRNQLEKSHQAFIICPLIEESEKTEAKAAVTEYERLKEQVFPRRRLGLLHGRMKSSQKEEAMNAFKKGEYEILVSTAVVEVGIDVPNATVILIEGANRFGLAQLHQFRGRVGRGTEQSYCLLLSDTPSEEGEQRLQAIEKTHDGFALAEEDLKMRGPGEFFGTRQSGLPNLKVAQLSDMRILEKAREEAARLFEADPGLQQPEHRLLAQRVDQFWQASESDLS